MWKRTAEECAALAKSNWWKGKTAREICFIQLVGDARLCMRFDVFLEAVAECLGQNVAEVEFQSEYNYSRLRERFLEKQPPLTPEEYANLASAYLGAGLPAPPDPFLLDQARQAVRLLSDEQRHELFNEYRNGDKGCD
jgi:hypothetical protein